VPWAQIYVLQYPLRPSLVGRANHLLDENLEGVRVKPKQCKLEVDLGLDPQSATYDPRLPLCPVWVTCVRSGVNRKRRWLRCPTGLYREILSG
jgi:hypothetical protein